MKGWRLLLGVAGLGLLPMLGGGADALAAAPVVQVQVSRASPCDQDTIAGMLKSAQGRIRRCVDGAPGSWSAKVQLTQSQPAAARQVHSTFEPRQQRCLMARVVRPLRATGAKQCLPQLKIVVD